MNEDSLGGYSPKKNNVLGTYSVGPCWCGQSYYVDPTDGLGPRCKQRRRSCQGMGSEDISQASVRVGDLVFVDWRWTGPAWILYHDFIEWHRPPDHLGIGASREHENRAASIACLQSGLRQDDHETPILSDCGSVAEPDGQCKSGSGGGQWTGICGQQQAIADLWTAAEAGESCGEEVAALRGEQLISIGDLCGIRLTEKW